MHRLDDRLRCVSRNGHTVHHMHKRTDKGWSAMKKKILPVVIIVLLILVVTGGIVISSLIKKYTPTDERQDLTEYFGISSDDEVAIIMNNELLSEKATIINDHVYLDYTFVHDYINERFYWDENENILLYATATDLVSVDADSTDYLVSKTSNSLDHVIEKATADSAWVSVEFVQLYSDFTYVCASSPNRIVITNNWGETITVASATKNTEVRVLGGIKSPILTDVESGTQLTVLAVDETWTEVATSDGIIGYIRSNLLGSTEEQELVSDYVEEEFTHILLDDEICMAWHQVTSTSANSDVASVLSSTKGVNVLSPTWFYLNDDEGNIACLAGSDYVTYCHQQGVQVWALVSNLENTDVDTTYVLTHTSTRQNLVNQIVSAAIQYDLDGINLDFEALSSEVGDAYIQFVRELSIKLANNNIILSIDNYVPSAYTAFYNRSEQALFADYIIIMGYDEHTSTSEEPGSVASLSWVTEAVVNTLEEVPAEQIILGMPFYTRIWTLTPDESSESEYVSYTVSSSAYGMTAANEFITNHGITLTWLDDCGQFYGETTSGDTVYQIWLEDSNSIEQRLKLLDTYSLAGASFWKLGFETSDIWDTVIKYIN